MLDLLPAGDALDLGCGSGLLGQAWIALGRGAVLACDLDPRALDQAARRADEITGRVVLANVPVEAHASLLSRIAAPPRAVLLSGLRPSQAPAVIDAYRALGLAAMDRRERGGFVAVCMAG